LIVYLLGQKENTKLFELGLPHKRFFSASIME